ncbi:MAG TPA: hypothetical protein VMF13_03720 [Luteitalea sp.]|nr:hypothetical protein [Luteitalea sp.]
MPSVRLEDPDTALVVRATCRESTPRGPMVTIEISRPGRTGHEAFQVATDAPIDVTALTVVARAILRVTTVNT